MDLLRKMINRFKDEDLGQGMVEYALILVLVSLVAVSSLGNVGGKVQDTLSKVTDSIGSRVELPEGYEAIDERVEIEIYDGFDNLKSETIQETVSSTLGVRVAEFNGLPANGQPLYLYEFPSNYIPKDGYNQYDLWLDHGIYHKVDGSITASSRAPVPNEIDGMPDGYFELGFSEGGDYFMFHDPASMKIRLTYPNGPNTTPIEDIGPVLDLLDDSGTLTLISNLKLDKLTIVIREMPR